MPETAAGSSVAPRDERLRLRAHRSSGKPRPACALVFLAAKNQRHGRVGSLLPRSSSRRSQATETETREFELCKSASRFRLLSVTVTRRPDAVVRSRDGPSVRDPEESRATTLRHPRVPVEIGPSSSGRLLGPSARPTVFRRLASHPVPKRLREQTGRSAGARAAAARVSPGRAARRGHGLDHAPCVRVLARDAERAARPRPAAAPPG